ncbi:MAG: YraN family protein [Nitrospirae bacterium]|nr:YraN family protein [Nitrospirota bacterium]MBI3351465.1 YraN family protein [Nitrospirota bacterium]
MTSITQEYGQEAENHAAQFLARRGYAILEKNYKTRFGEIDLIAKDQEYLVFVEIKARKNDHFGGARAAITPTKRKKIIQMAKFYIFSKKIESDVRFDVVLILGPIDSPSVELIQNAFDLSL